MRSIVILFISLITINSFALDPIEMTVTECRKRCDTDPQSGYCFRPNKHPSGSGKAVLPFIDLVNTAEEPQVFIDSTCKQKITSSKTELIISDKDCTTEHTNWFGDLIKTTFLDGSKASISWSLNQEVEIGFTDKLPIFEIPIYDEPVGGKEVQFVTTGFNVHRQKESIIWFDGYYCHTIDRD